MRTGRTRVAVGAAAAAATRRRGTCVGVSAVVGGVVLVAVGALVAAWVHVLSRAGQGGGGDVGGVVAEPTTTTTTTNAPPRRPPSEPPSFESNCEDDRPRRENRLVLRVEADESRDEDVARQLQTWFTKDPSLSVGLAVAVQSADDRTIQPDITLHLSRTTRSSSKSPPPTKECPATVTTPIHPDATQTYLAALDAVARTAVSLLQPRSRKDLHIALLFLWTGFKKPPPKRMMDAAIAFADSSPAGFVTPIILTEAPHADFVRASLGNHPNVLVLTDFISTSTGSRNGNLSSFIHTQADELVSGIRGHEHYALGWNLCDFRWLFGAMFHASLSRLVTDKSLPPFTHWGWGDADARPGDWMGAVTNYGRDFLATDIVSFAHVDADPKHVPSTPSAYVSGTLTVVKNTPQGRALFRHTPLDGLERALRRSSNAILDESGSSNAALGAGGVTVTLISSQLRNKGIFVATNSVPNRIFTYARNDAVAAAMTNMSFVQGRVQHPFHVASLGPAVVRQRFKGDAGFPGAVDAQLARLGELRSFASRVGLLAPKWIAEPPNPAWFVLGGGRGTGFASLIRDASGAWWHRPYPREWVSPATFRVMRVQVAMAHLRSDPCLVSSENDAWVDRAKSLFGEELERAYAETFAARDTCLPPHPPRTDTV